MPPAARARRSARDAGDLHRGNWVRRDGERDDAPRRTAIVHPRRCWRGPGVPEEDTECAPRLPARGRDAPAAGVRRGLRAGGFHRAKWRRSPKRSTNPGRATSCAPRRGRSGPGSWSCGCVSSGTTRSVRATKRSSRASASGSSGWSAPSGRWPIRRTRTGARLRSCGEEFGPANTELVNLVETQLAGLEAQADAAGVPWTPGRRIPR